jgi:hypothetical protein
MRYRISKALQVAGILLALEAVVSMFYGVILYRRIAVAWGRVCLLDYDAASTTAFAWKTAGTPDWDIHIARALGFVDPWFQTGGGRWSVEVPILLVAALLFGIGVFARPRSSGGILCKKCSYDLRANVTACCPECGMVLTFPHGSYQFKS